MYSVVGCSECKALWVVEGRPATSQCPQCGTRRPFDARRQFVTTDEPDHAREVRSRCSPTGAMRARPIDHSSNSKRE
ncbi:MAG: DUF5817 domain-containing protein [Natrialbaceae archaeon]|nr:DUF5817 domain-containing protein [Natrialbaceae archaeon]